ncbi:MAG: 50S ribosomal protein L16 [Candidatus Lokiarchaeota archaeon]|nr:50S ribosomal protein L16 [Candidatus Lokiarchaeota archaeon]
MARRPWQCYRRWKRPPYQKKRSRSHRKEYVRGGAEPKIRIFDSANRKKPLKEWDLSIGLRARHRVQISHFALEAVRASINRRLLKKIGRMNFHIRIRPHPWQVYRENKMMAFAGADRLQSGMRGSFGRCIGTCARVRANQPIVEVFCDYKNKAHVIRALKIATYKIPTKCRMVILRVNDRQYLGKLGLPLSLERPLPQQ